MHPGTNVAKSFSSDVNLLENDIPRRTLIKMNEPLRHKGYAFSSFFIDDSDVEQLSLQRLKTTEDYSLIFQVSLSIGLLIHLLLMIPKMVGRKSK